MGKYLPYAALLSAVLYFLWFVPRGIILYDEGYILEAVNLTYKGLVPYKDFFFQYPPLTIWLGAFWFKLFSPGIITLRVLGLLISFLIVAMSFFIGKRFGGEKAGFLVALTFTAWGFPNVNFFWPSQLSILFILLSFFFVLKFIDEKGARWILGAGAGTGLTLLTRQNFGVALFLALTVWLMYLWIEQEKKFKLSLFYIGIGVVVLVSSLILFLNSSFISVIHDLGGITLRAAFGDIVYSPFPLFFKPTPGLMGLLKWFGKFMIYPVPLIAFFSSALYLLIKKKRVDKVWFGAFCLSFFHFVLTIWPTSDLIHATFALPPFFIFLSASGKNFSDTLKKLVLLLVVAYSFLGFYRVFYLPHYSFETPYLEMQEKVEIKGQKLWVDKKYKTIITGVLEAREETIKDQAYFVHPFAPALYFITDSKPPVPYLHTIPTFLTESEQEKIIEELERKRVEWVFVEEWRVAEGTLLSKYLKDSFKEYDRYWDIILNKRI